MPNSKSPLTSILEKKFGVILILFISMIIFAVPFYWFGKRGNWQTESTLEARTLAPLPSVNNGKQMFIEGVNDFANDHFPFRDALIRLGRSLEHAQIDLAYVIMKDTAVPASLDTDFLFMKDDFKFFGRPAIFGYIRQIYLDMRIENYKEIINTLPNIDFFVFYFERMEFSPHNPARSFFPKADNRASFQYFLDNKPEDLIVSTLIFNSFVEYKKDFFNTDHHWNARGAWRAYEIIYEMLSESNPNDFGPILSLEEFRIIEGVEFCGSYSRRSLRPCLADYFEVPIFNHSECVTYINGIQREYGNRNKYLKGDFDTSPYINHYAEFYGETIDLVHYQCSNNNRRNILIIGNSYSQAIQLQIATHYKNTYVVDLNDFNEFSLNKFLEDKPVDDVLILGDVIVYGWPNWSIPL